VKRLTRSSSQIGPDGENPLEIVDSAHGEPWTTGLALRCEIRASKKGAALMHAQVVLYVGFDPLDVIAPYEVLHAAGMATGGAVTSNW
jgi:hypothetical protein